MTIYFGNKSHNIIFGNIPIEKMGGNKLTYSMYGDNIPVVLEDEFIIKVYSNSTTIFLTNKGRLFGCGRNNNSELGLNNIDIVSTITLIAENVKDFEASTYMVTYIDNNNALWFSGNCSSLSMCYVFTKIAENVAKIIIFNDSLRYISLNHNVYKFVNVFESELVVENVIDYIYLGGGNEFYINLNNELYKKGNTNPYGQLGTGHFNDTIPSFIKEAENVHSFYSEGTRSLYLTNDGNLYVAGYNSDGSLGNGTTSDIASFTKVAENVKKVSHMYGTTMYINNNNELLLSGSNDFGEQGSGNTLKVTRFTKRADNVKDCITSGNTSWYITLDKELYGTGRNQFANQGDGTTVDVKTFTKHADNVDTVYCENTCTCYLSEGKLYRCGRNSYSQQGGTTASTFTEIELPK